MNAYHALAASYDRLTNDVDYEATVEFYMQILQREGVQPRTVVDLACGTGSVTKILAQKGYDVTGVDMSEEMLTQAHQKVQGMDHPPVSSAGNCRNCICRRLWIWQSARWTVWIILQTLLTAPRQSAVHIRR